MIEVFEYNGKRALETRQLWENGIIAERALAMRIQRAKGTDFFKILHRSAPGISAVLEYDSIPFDIRQKIDKLTIKPAVTEVETKTLLQQTIVENNAALAFFENYKKDNGENLNPEKIQELYNNAKILTAIVTIIDDAQRMNDVLGPNRKKVSVSALVEQLRQLNIMHSLPTTERNLRPFIAAVRDKNYAKLVHGNTNNDNARVVSDKTENLLLALRRSKDKPFVTEVHKLYSDFINGNKEFFDTTTAERYYPEDYRYNGKPLDISLATAWNVLKDVVNDTAVYSDRNGNFDYINKKRPKHQRHRGTYSLSKITMDDSVLSRKSVRGWISRYHATDVVSGYWFTPEYLINESPDTQMVYNVFRNIFCELDYLGLPMPGELDVENHLMKHIDWLQEEFPFVYFNPSPTSKHAEHSIKALKWGVAKKNKHTRGRWYSPSEAYKAIRTKIKGDFVEPEYDPIKIIQEDLADIEEHNNSPHPDQKKYPDKTRKQVFLENINPNLQEVTKWRLYKYIGNQVETANIYNNDYVKINDTQYQLQDYNDLTKLKSNNLKVDVYWLPDSHGKTATVYLYQNGEYIGSAAPRQTYNDCKIEWTDADKAAILSQEKKVAQYDKFIKERKNSIPKGIECINATITQSLKDIVAETMPEPEADGNDLDKILNKYINNNYREMAIANA